MSLNKKRRLKESLSDEAKEIILDECDLHLKVGGSEIYLLDDIKFILDDKNISYNDSEVEEYMNKCLSGEIKKPLAATIIEPDFDSKFATDDISKIDPEYTMNVEDAINYLNKFDEEDILVFKQNNKIAPVTGSTFKHTDNIYSKNEDLNMATGSDDSDGEIAAMRAEQKEKEAAQAARKERYALYHKLFDEYEQSNPDDPGLDRIHSWIRDAVEFKLLDKISDLPQEIDGQKVRYRFSMSDKNIYTDPYKDYIFVVLDKGLRESLGSDYSHIPSIEAINYTNPTGPRMPGLNERKFKKALEEIGLDAFKIRSSQLRSVSHADLRDAFATWYLEDNPMYPWKFFKDWDTSEKGFNEFYFFYKGSMPKDPKKLKEDFDLEDERDILMKAHQYKCKLRKSDIEETLEPKDLIEDMEYIYNKLCGKYDDVNIRYWRFVEDGIVVRKSDGQVVRIEDDEFDKFYSKSISESNELEKRAKHHRKHQKGMSPFYGLAEEYEFILPYASEEDSDNQWKAAKRYNLKYTEHSDNGGYIKLTGSKEDLEKYCDAHGQDCRNITVVKETELTESKKKKKPYSSINKNAGNVEHNINMFNTMNNATESPSTNPTGPMAEDIELDEGRHSKRNIQEVIDTVRKIYLANTHNLVDGKLHSKYLRTRSSESSYYFNQLSNESLINLLRKHTNFIIEPIDKRSFTVEIPELNKKQESIAEDTQDQYYTPKRYGEWWWGIIDPTTHLMLRDSNNKLVLFKSKILAQDRCDELNKEKQEPLTDEISKKETDESLNEARNDPYFKPYGYRDAAKVLNGKAPQYYYHLKEIEMDKGDGEKLARYARKIGLPVVQDPDDDPDYPTFYILGKYHWNDYFYPYPSDWEPKEDEKVNETLIYKKAIREESINAAKRITREQKEALRELSIILKENKINIILPLELDERNYLKINLKNNSINIFIKPDGELNVDEEDLYLADEYDQERLIDILSEGNLHESFDSDDELYRVYINGQRYDADYTYSYLKDTARELAKDNPDAHIEIYDSNDLVIFEIYKGQEYDHAFRSFRESLNEALDVSDMFKETSLKVIDTLEKAGKKPAADLPNRSWDSTRGFIHTGGYDLDKATVGEILLNMLYELDYRNDAKIRQLADYYEHILERYVRIAAGID